MAKLVQLAICLVIVRIQSITSQCLHQVPPPQQPYYRFEVPRQFDVNPNIPQNQYYNGPLIDTPPPKQTTVVSDCTPEVCKNLVNTIQLLIVTNLLKNTRKSPTDAAIRLASPVINEVLSSVQNNPCLSQNNGLIGTGLNPGSQLGSIQNDQLLTNNGLINSNLNPGIINSGLLGGLRYFNPGFVEGSGLNNVSPRLISNNVVSASPCSCLGLGNQGLSANLINLLNNFDSL